MLALQYSRGGIAFLEAAAAAAAAFSGGDCCATIARQLRRYLPPRIQFHETRSRFSVRRECSRDANVKVKA